MLLPSACVYPEMKHVGNLEALSPNFPGALYLDICTPVARSSCFVTLGPFIREIISRNLHKTQTPRRRNLRSWSIQPTGSTSHGLS